MGKAKYFLLAGLCIVFLNCAKDLHSNVTPGPVADTLNLEIQSLKDSIKCLQPKGDNWVIKTQEEFAQTPKDPHDICKTWINPKFDFDRYSIVGYSTFCGGCKDPIVINRFIKLPKEKKYKIIVSIVEIGDCDFPHYFGGWFKVPKIEEGYTVEFETKKTYQLNAEQSEKFKPYQPDNINNKKSPK